MDTDITAHYDELTDMFEVSVGNLKLSFSPQDFEHLLFVGDAAYQDYWDVVEPLDEADADDEAFALMALADVDENVDEEDDVF